MGPHCSLRRLRRSDDLERQGLPEVWRRWVAEALTLVDHLDGRIVPLDAELALAAAEPRVCVLTTAGPPSKRTRGACLARFLGV